MATHTCNQNCGCTNSYTVTAPCPPACSEVFNAACIVYTGTDITCNTTTVISRYDYLDTVITKLVNYICNTVGPVTQVVGSEYIDVVPATVGNVTTYTVSVDIPALQAYFDIIIAQTIASSFFAGPGIDVAVNPITSAVTVSHEDTSSVANLSSDNSGNSFIQDIFFTFDTFGHVTGASVVPGSVIPPNDFDRAQINPDSGFVWGPDNDPTNIQIAQAPGDTLNFVAGTGIVLNASTVPGTEAIRITNSAPDQTVVLNEGADIDITGTYPNFTIANTAPNVDQNLWLTLEGDTGSAIAAGSPIAALTIAGANGIITNTTGTTLTITGSGGSNPFTYEVGQYVVAEGGVITHRWLSTVPNGTPTAGATQNYIVVDLNNLSSPAQWASIDVDISNVESTYDGETNTINLIAAGAGSGITVGTAAELCDVSIAGGQTDWYLPAVDELSKLWQNRWEVAQGLGVGGGTQLDLQTYWSSTEENIGNAYHFTFINGAAASSGKNISYFVRAVRRFSI